MNNIRKTVKFHNALLKDGFENFTWEVLKECASQEELDYYEDFYINEFNCLDRDKGYNLKSGGKLGGCYSDEAKEHMGESTKKKWQNPEIAEKMLAGLRKGTETVKQRASENYVEHECPVCHKVFRTKKWNSHKYCSLECANIDLKSTLKKKSDLGVAAIREKYKNTQQERFDLIIEWLQDKSNANLVKSAKLNDLKYLNILSSYIGVKDPRSLAKVLSVTNKRDTHNKLKELLMKIYAVPSDN